VIVNINDSLSEWTNVRLGLVFRPCAARPGRYVARLMKDDGYAELARTRFRVDR
jgi:hypothetical protein